LSANPISLRAIGFEDDITRSNQGHARRPLKLLIVVGVFLFFGVYRLRWLMTLTYDWYSLYLAYLTGYIGNTILVTGINFTEINYVIQQSWLGQLQGASVGGVLGFDDFMGIWTTIISVEIAIGVVGVLAVYSALALRRSYLAKIGCLALILAGIFDIVSQIPLIESIFGVICLIVLIRPDVKNAYATKEGRLTGTAPSQKEEVTFSADLSRPKVKPKVGKKCPKCGMLLPPSAKICRRCKTRLKE
jgi:hypothetical protein